MLNVRPFSSTSGSHPASEGYNTERELLRSLQEIQSDFEEEAKACWAVEPRKEEEEEEEE